MALYIWRASGGASRSRRDGDASSFGEKWRFFRETTDYYGVPEIAGKRFNIAGASRDDKAATIDEAKYRKFQIKEAQKLGLDLGEESA